MNPYESQELVDQYLLFHYGTAEEVLPYDFGPNAALFFPVRTVRETLAFFSSSNPDGNSRRALDLGCAVGRASFELSKLYDQVIGIDYSRAFIAAADKLKRDGSVSYHRLDEGRSSVELIAKVPEGCHPERVEFETGDAMRLRSDLGAFELVHAANLLCRLARPKNFLKRLATVTAPGGHLILTTPCTWSTDFTPKRNWPKTSTIDFITHHLEGDFDLIQTLDLPFLIREHARKFQWSVAEASIWARKTAE